VAGEVGEAGSSIHVVVGQSSQGGLVDKGSRLHGYGIGRCKRELKIQSMWCWVLGAGC